MSHNFFFTSFVYGVIGLNSAGSYAAIIGPGTINSTVSISDGSSSTIVSNTALDTTSSNTIASYITNGTLVLGGTNILIQSGFYGILVEPGTAGSLISAPGSAVTIRTTGARSESYGIAAKYSSATLSLDTIDIGTTGNGAAGLILDSGATGTAKNMIISTTGTRDTGNNNASAYGVSVQNGSQLELSNSTITTSGVSSTALFNISSQFIGSNLNVSTSNTSSYGSATQSAATQLTDVTINTTGQLGIGSFIIGKVATGATFNGSHNQITTQGTSAYGLVSAEYTSTQLSDYQINTSGTNGHGVYSSGADSHINASAINVTTTGANAYGSISNNGGDLSLDHSDIVTTGDSAYGVVVYSNISTLLPTRAAVSESTITTLGASAHGLSIIQGGDLTISNSTTRVTGADAAALFIRSDAGKTGTAVINNSSLYSSSTGIYIPVGEANITLNNTKVEGQNLWLHVGDLGARAALPVLDPLPAEDAPGIISNTLFTGFKEQKALAVINAAATVVANGSTLIGAAFTGIDNTSDVTLNNSLWEMTDSSNLTNLINNNSIIQFTQSNAGYKQLTVNDYAGTTGAIHLNTYLGHDASPSDLLVIDSGSATGITALHINNTTGAGASTVANGILVIEALNGATTSNNAFTLNGRAIAGPYEYSLFRGSVDDSGLENWYLRSQLDCSSGVVSEECLSPLSPDQPNYRKEVSVYSTLTSMASIYSRTLLDTLDERVGIQNNLTPAGSDKVKPSAIWGRVIGAHGVHKGGRYGIYNQEGARFDYTIGGFQTGFDLYREEHKNHVGVYGAAGKINGDTQERNHLKAGWNKIDAYTLGAYWTHYGTSGWYFDGITQGTWYDANATSIDAIRLKTDGSGFAASLEGGTRPFKWANHWTLVPQAQFVYQNIGLDNAQDSAATVWFHNTDYMSGRIGARLSKEFAASKSISDVTGWLRPSLWREFKGNAVTSFSSEMGSVPFTSNLGGNWFEITSGLTAKIKDHLKLYASAGYDIGLNNSNKSYAYNGSIGANMVW